MVLSIVAPVCLIIFLSLLKSELCPRAAADPLKCLVCDRIWIQRWPHAPKLAKQFQRFDGDRPYRGSASMNDAQTEDFVHVDQIAPLHILKKSYVPGSEAG